MYTIAELNSAMAWTPKPTDTVVVWPMTRSSPPSNPFPARHLSYGAGLHGPAVPATLAGNPVKLQPDLVPPDKDWNSYHTKLTYNWPDQDKILVPYGSTVPWGERIDDANELAWLTSTQDLDIATTIDIMRANRVKAFTLDDPSSLDPEQDDDSLYLIPSPQLLDKIEWERQSLLSGPVITAKLMKGLSGATVIGKARRDGPEITHDMAKRLVEALVTDNKLPDPALLASNRRELITRANWYGKDWLLSLVTPEEARRINDPLTRQLDDYGQADPYREDFPQSRTQEDKDADLLAEIKDALTHKDPAYGEEIWSTELCAWVYRLDADLVALRSELSEKNPIDSPESLGVLDLPSDDPEA